MPNIPEDWGNNFYKSGWQPGLEVNEQTGLGEITHVGTDPDYRNKFDSILQEWGFNPEHYEIEGSVPTCVISPNPVCSFTSSPGCHPDL